MAVVAHETLSNEKLWGIDLTLISGLEAAAKGHLQKMVQEDRLL